MALLLLSGVCCFAASSSSLQKQLLYISPPPPRKTRRGYHYYYYSSSLRPICNNNNNYYYPLSITSSSQKKKKIQHTIVESQSVCYPTRRVSILAVILALPPTPYIPARIYYDAKAADLEEAMLVRYTDSKEGFTLLVPHTWLKVDKAGATALFEDPSNSANNIGVVVSPVRLLNLQEFGTPEFVADKLIQAERRKESTKDAEVVAVSERSGKGGLQVYEFEYKVDSTRGGLKRVFSAAFVASRKLYILNISHSDKPSPLDLYRRTILQQVVDSFDSTELPMTS